jgi:hypothetical protein
MDDYKGSSFFQERQKKGVELLENIKKNISELEKLLVTVNGDWVYDDAVYRYYHYSFKVYYLQEKTLKIVELLKSISPHEDKGNLNKFFLEILEGGTGKIFESSHNKEWSKNCRPILEAFFHAKYFLEMAIKYGKELDEAPACLPSGWAGLLYLYNIR